MFTEFWCVQCPRPAGPSALDKHQFQSKCFNLSHFPSESKCKFINLIHTRQQSKIICLSSWKIMSKLVLKREEYKRNLPSEKSGSVDVTITRANTHQKHHAQCGRSIESALDIFNRGFSRRGTHPVRTSYRRHVGFFFFFFFFLRGAV